MSTEWPDSEENKLKILYASMDVKEVLKYFPNRSRASIYQKANYMGLSKKNKQIQDIQDQGFKFCDNCGQVLEKDVNKCPKCDFIELFPNDEVNSVYYILKAIKLTLLSSEVNSPGAFQEAAELFRFSEVNSKKWKETGYILINDHYRNIFFYILENGATTNKILNIILKIPLKSCQRITDELLRRKLILRSMRLSRPKGVKGGPRITVYEVPGCTEDQLKAICELNLKLESKKYGKAIQLAQACLEDYPMSQVNKEIKRREILEKARLMKFSEIGDLTDLATNYLQKEGIKVYQ